MSAQRRTIKPFSALATSAVKLQRGILDDRWQKNLQNLFLRMDVRELQRVYEETHDPFYAEPEFCGHYLAAGADLFRSTDNEEILARVRALANSIVSNQRADGYLGTYKPGFEFDHSFSVWNQGFTMMGLLAYYELTGDEAALDTARRCADYVADSFLAPGGPELLHSVNYGIQHTCIIKEFAQLYGITGEQRYLRFCDYIIERWESSNLRLLSVPLNLKPFFCFAEIGCQKSIEVMVCYQGLVKLYQATGDEQYLDAADNYWKAVREQQIGITGNGSIAENWNYLGNASVNLWNELRPNENCVAVGFMQLAADLAEIRGESHYWDAFERTLYNHLLGAQALDGSDFSYYQGNIGVKVHERDPAFPSCCRFRGMRMLAFLPRYVYTRADDGLLVNLFISSHAEVEINEVRVEITQTGTFPREGEVTFHIKPARATRFTLQLRMPEWCPSATITIGGKPWHSRTARGYHQIEKEWSVVGDTVRYDMEMPFTVTESYAGGLPSAAIGYGPLVLAMDSRYGTPIESTRIDIRKPERLTKQPLPADAWTPIVAVTVPGEISRNATHVTLVDYASAGSVDHGVDQFRVWIPQLVA